MKKQWIGVLVAVVLLISLTACGKKSESDIQADFMSQDSYVESYGMTVDSFQIIDRQTTDKSDIVTVHIETSNSDFSLTRDCRMDYEKYNDGWKLDFVSTDYMDYLADNTKITQSDADNAVSAYDNGNLTFVKREESNNHITFYYSKQEESYYRVREYTVCADYIFDPDSQWYVTVTEEQTKSAVDLVGEWSYQDSERSYWVKIIDFDTANRRVRYEYEFHDTKNIGDGYTHFIYDAKSNGEVVGTYYSYGFESWQEGTASWHMDTAERGLKQLGFFVGEEAKMKNGMNAGVYFNNYWLTRR